MTTLDNTVVQTPEKQDQTEQKQEGQAPNPLEAVLEGEAVPEKFRGKKTRDVLQVARDLEAAKTQLEQEVSQWRMWAAQKLQALEQQAAPPQAPPPPEMEPEALQAVQQVVQKTVNPILEGVGRMMKEYTKSVRPDFEQYEQKATMYYNALPPEYKVHPEYGWDFAYRLAKAEAMGVAKPQTQPPPPAPSTTDIPPAKPSLSEEEKRVARIYGLSDEEYRKFSEVIDPTAYKGGS